jgi:hypothetical protein
MNSFTPVFGPIALTQVNRRRKFVHGVNRLCRAVKLASPQRLAPGASLRPAQSEIA